MDCQHELETQVVHLSAFLRSELGYHADAPGAVQRELQEHEEMLTQINETLRGRDDELGLVGWLMVLRRTWITMVALLGMALGYVLNDVVDAISLHRAPDRITASMKGGAMKGT